MIEPDFQSDFCLKRYQIDILGVFFNCFDILMLKIKKKHHAPVLSNRLELLNHITF